MSRRTLQIDEKKKLQTNRRSPTSDEFIHHICKYMTKNGVFILKFIDKWTSFTNTTHTYTHIQHTRLQFVCTVVGHGGHQTIELVDFSGVTPHIMS